MYSALARGAHVAKHDGLMQQGPHRARTGPAQGPHRARTGPAVKTHTILQAASGVQEDFYLLQVKFYSGARSYVFLQRALCGPCAGPVRALCGPCVGRSPVQIMRKNHLCGKTNHHDVSKL